MDDCGIKNWKELNDFELIEALNKKYEQDYQEYIERQKDPEVKKIVEAIRVATNGEFVGQEWCSTCMGWIIDYDEQGRPLNANPNYRDSTIHINGHLYNLTRVGWFAYISLPDTSLGYCAVMGGSCHSHLLTKVDLRPDYVRECAGVMEDEDYLPRYLDPDHIIVHREKDGFYLIHHATITAEERKPKPVFAPYVPVETTAIAEDSESAPVKPIKTRYAKKDINFDGYKYLTFDIENTEL